MLLLILFRCTAGDDDETWPIDEEMAALEKEIPFNLRTVQTCAVLSEHSPTFPERLVFLYKLDGKGIDAQAELIAVTTTRLRCGEVHLALKPGKEGTNVMMDFMSPKDPVVIDELRIYPRLTNWSEQDPYAVAKETHIPWSDYVFRVNQIAPATDDVSTILVGQQ